MREARRGRREKAGASIAQLPWEAVRSPYAPMELLSPDQMQDLFRGLGSDTAVLLDGGGSSAIVLRRDTGGMWAGAGVPRGSCDTRQVLCDSRERALPSGRAFN